MSGFFQKKSVDRLFKKLNVVPVDDGRQLSATIGYQALRAWPNGARETATHWCISIDNLKDPNRAEYDHFTSYYPKTLKAAIYWMTR